MFRSSRRVASGERGLSSGKGRWILEVVPGALAVRAPESGRGDRWEERSPS